MSDKSGKQIGCERRRISGSLSRTSDVLAGEERAFFPAKSHLRRQQWFSCFFGTSKN